MGLMWLWVLIAAVLGGLALTIWGLWWLWRKVAGIGERLEGLLGRLDELAGIVEGIDPDRLDGPVGHASDKA
ncbi:hypothetical protein [Acidipropionibacterium acidipropionici]|jgi:hypothetical protein|uniref:hypothetical protein n=1 Tax=Acidipropionibacterium acidipropionici TaxID=1748 RepID=UPI00110A5F14|nr:hypothetical protein [Acidipropionibacterium acidipropionici]QCV94804.1 hypothetical protein FEZ30_05555 [Acidipropionibacterium acidipropionici]